MVLHFSLIGHCLFWSIGNEKRLRVGLILGLRVVRDIFNSLIENIHEVALFFNWVSYPHINTIWKQKGNYLSWLGWKVDEILLNMHHIIRVMWGLGKRSMILYEIGIAKKSMKSWDRNLVSKTIRISNSHSNFVWKNVKNVFNIIWVYVLKCILM